MSNSFFQFKQFTIYQDNCAMKVCTDSCLFGAYVAEAISSKKIALKNILDIGTGTGLLALQLAQKNIVNIDAIEIDTAAYSQGKENFERSPWKERLNIFNENVLSFFANKKYDLIITNPPFFEASLQSINKEKNAAKHDTTLTLNALLISINIHLSLNGIAAVLLPYSRLDDFIKLIRASNFYIQEKVLIKQTPTHNYFRVFILMSRKKTILVEETIVIKNEQNQYTDRFKALLKDYYLHL